MAKVTEKHALNYLNNLIESFFAIDGYDSPEFHMKGNQEPNVQTINYCNEFWLKHHQAQFRLGKHQGFPVEHFAQPVSNMAKADPRFKNWVSDARLDFCAEIGAHSAALSNYYPKNGFVGWHTNHNAAAYQILFTWSKTGEGFFRYFDQKTNQIVEIPDRKGWTVKLYRFGSIESELCWHCAWTNCPRMTLAYKYLLDDNQTDYFNQVLEELTT